MNRESDNNPNRFWEVTDNGEYVDWAQDMSRSIVGSVVAQVDVLRDQLDQ